MFITQLFLAVGLTVGSFAPQESRPTVTLRPEAFVEGSSIELAEIATITNAEPGLTAALEALDLGYAPSPSYSRTLVANKIADEIARAFPGVPIALDGAVVCKIWPRTQTVARTDIELAARTALETAVTGERVTLALRAPIDDVIVPVSVGAPDIRAVLNNPNVQSGTQSVTVRIELEGRVHATRQVHYDVQRWQTVAVLRRPIASGTIVTPDMVEEREVLVPPSQREPSLTTDMLIGAVTARYIDAGRAIQRVDVHRPKVVEPRAAVILEIRHGQITARAAAIALEEGAGGDRIRVKILDSGREMHATVVSRDLVVVELEAPTPLR
jgi:flagella basal body P-ring formation protein FlgA